MTKRTLTFLLCTLLVASVLILPAAANTVLPGDLNEDGQRTAIDYFALKRYVLGTHMLSESALEAADLNGDGDVNAKDYLLLKRVILGTYALPEPEPPEETPDETLSLLKLSLILQNGNGEQLAVLEAILPGDLDTLGKLLERYLGELPFDDELRGEADALLGDREALTAFADQVVQIILDKLLPVS